MKWLEQIAQRTARLRHSLPLKITVPMVAIVLGLSGISVVVVGQRVTRIHERAELEEVTHFGAVVETLLGRETASGHVAIDQQLTWLCATAGKTAFIVDRHDQVRFSCDSALLATAIPAQGPGELSVVRNGVAFGRWVRPLSNGPACSACHPDGESVGSIGVDVPAEEKASEVREQQRLNVVVGVCLAAAIAIVLTVVQTLFVYRPVVKLTRTVERIRGGDLSVRIAGSRNDEVGRLGQSVNEMTASLERAKEELERTHRAKLAQSEKLAALGQLFTSVAHEIKNQLAGIIGALKVLEQEVPSDHENKAVLGKILARMEKMSQTAVSSLEFARPLKGQLGSVDVLDLLDRTLFFIERQATEQKVLVRKRYGRDLPHARVDEDLMREVLLNVLLNGVQAMPLGGTLDVEVRVSRPHLIDIAISDQGVGIPAENLERIFSPFFTTKAQGTGLGLYLAKQIVETQRGEITVESHLGQGTSFTLRVPSVTGDEEVPHVEG